MAAYWKRVDWWRVTLLLAAIVVSGFVGYHFHPMLANNPDAVNVVVTIFSVLAGFLIAVITFITEPALRQAKDWRELQRMKKTIRRKLFRQKALFILYLLTLGTALVMYLTPAEAVEVLMWLRAVFLGLATFVFIASFSLPYSLIRVQMERYEAALEETRPKVITEAKKVAEQAKEKQA